jgi:hypothetical protein
VRQPTTLACQGRSLERQAVWGGMNFDKSYIKQENKKADEIPDHTVAKDTGVAADPRNATLTFSQLFCVLFVIPI